MSLRCDFSRLRTEWSYLPTHALSLASPIQGMPGMAWWGVAWYGMAWRERSVDVRPIGDIVFSRIPQNV